MKIDELKSFAADIDLNQYKTPIVKNGCVYFICDDDNEVIYIGGSIRLDVRIKEHLKNFEFCNKKFFFYSIPIEDLCNAERILIKKFKPKYNKQMHNELMNKPSMFFVRKIKVDCSDIKKQIIEKINQKKITYTKIAKYLNASKQWAHYVINNKDLETEYYYQKLTDILAMTEKGK
jgi:hypothetical protein